MKPPLPGKPKGWPAVADLTYLIDTREQIPYRFPRSRRATLREGDYTVEGLEGVVAVERKSLPDAFASIGRGRKRFEAEVARLAKLRWSAIVVEAGTREILDAPPSFSSLEPRIVLLSLASWSVRYGVHVFFASGRTHGNALTAHLLKFCSREFAERGEAWRR